MILIEAIKYFEVDDDPHAIYHMHAPYECIEVITKDGTEVREASTVRELCHGRRFVRPSDGKEIRVAMARDVQDILGMQFEAWEGLEERLEAERFMNTKMSTRLHTVRMAPWWKRLKWLFTGVDI